MTIRSSRSFRLAAAAVVVSSAAIVGTATTASASSGCGEYSFGFEGTRLLNDGISDSAGPFTISMPAGTYDITLHSFDDHAAHPGQLEQTQEQWYFALDSGYTSPVSSDIPEDVNSVVDTFSNIVIEEATAISVHHLGEGGVNSVAPMCVGFTSVTPEPVEEEVVEEVDVPAAEVEREVVEPDAPIEEEVVEEADVPVEVEGVIEIRGPQAPAVAAAAAPAPQLALTGPSAQLWAMVISGASLVAIGGSLVVGERRRSLEA